METRPRSEFGMVRTTKDEFESLEDDAWWMHERCMEPADLRGYFGGEKELANARAVADAADAEAAASSSGGKVAQKPVDPVEAAKERVRAMSVKELKAYMLRNGASTENCVEKSDLLAKALEVAAKAPLEPVGPAWMPTRMVCRLCTKPPGKEQGGVICRRRRSDGSLSGCGEGICFRCMKKAPRDAFGQVRTTKEEFESLEEEAWWMHERCFADGDYKDYFGESEPEEFYNRRTKADQQDWEWDDSANKSRPQMGSIMRRQG